MTTLIATLSPPHSNGAHAAEVAYCQVTNAQTVSSYGTAAIGLLPRADEVVLLLPAQAVSWHWVPIPKLARSISAVKLRALVDGLAEELVLDDTAQLHISLYRPKTGDTGKAWLAVCNTHWLAEQLQSFQAAGHRVRSIIASAYPLTPGAGEAQRAEPGMDNLSGAGEAGTLRTAPAISARIHVSGSLETAMVTVADALGVLTVPLNQARLIWPGISDGDNTISAEPAVAAAAEASLGTKVTVVQSAQVALQAMLDANNDGLNLAQGAFALSGSDRWLQKFTHTARNLLSAPAWRTARVGAVVLAVAHLLGLNAWAWKERSSLEAKRGQTTQLLTQNFPQVKVIVDAPVQMQRELALLRQASGSLGSRDLENLMAKFYGAATAATTPSTIEFANGELSLKGTGLGASQLSELQPKLRAAGLAVRSEADRIVVAEQAAARAPSAPGAAP
jgi:general secretion pathway protein L